MPLSFVETMRGWIRDDAGLEHPIAFEVWARRERGGRFAIDGLVSAPPHAEEAVARGTLVIAPFAPAITYELRFRGSDGTPLLLTGRKRPSLRSPVRSMTWMPVELAEEGARVRGRGGMRFALRDLPRFLASWLPFASGAARRLAARRELAERRLPAGG